MENGETSTYDALPERRITAGQLVAWNLARLRREADMLQEDLGARIGWDKKAVSSAERSWEKRPRQFDAATIVALAAALHVPLAAFLLPPDDDGVTCRYVLATPDGQPDMSMADLVAYVISDPGEDETPVMDYYRQRYANALSAYLDPARIHEITGTTAAYTTEEFITGRIAQLQEHYDNLRGVLLDIDGQQDALARRLEEVRKEEEQ